MTGTPIDIIGLASLATGAASRLLKSESASSSAFADMLGKAKNDFEPSGLPVGLGKGVEIELTDDQLKRLAVAADRAESQGAQTAVVMLDGRALEIDVTLRQVIGEVSPEQGVRPEIDTFLFAPPQQDAAGPPAGAARNPDLLRMLAERDS